MNDKDKLRNYYRANRAVISKGTAMRSAWLAQDILLASSLWKNAQRIGLFASMPEEISTDRLIEEAVKKTGTVWLPKTIPGNFGHMRFEACRDVTALSLSPMGIREPGDGQSMDAGDHGCIPDLLIIPGLAFDLSGMRLGYGGGFYDRFLSANPESVSVGFCYSCQLVDKLPHEEWDRPVRYICTEEGLICL